MVAWDPFLGYGIGLDPVRRNYHRSREHRSHFGVLWGPAALSGTTGIAGADEVRVIGVLDETFAVGVYDESTGALRLNPLLRQQRYSFYVV